MEKIQMALMVVLILALGVVLTLVTPLRHIPLLTPVIEEVDPIAFAEDFAANPDKYVFIDVRSLDSYTQVHAEGSISMPLHTLYDEWKNLPRNTDKTIVLICSGGRAAGVGYHYLEHHGFFNIKRIEGGIEAWQEAGLPVNRR
jgi:rhodanese-related sulfurtransferase